MSSAVPGALPDRIRICIAPMPNPTSESAQSIAVLAAARAAIAANPDPDAGRDWQGCGVKNPPLLNLLDSLIGAAQPVANAIADNCWDDCLPIPAAGAKRLADDLHRMADTILAAAAPNATEWSLPSMTNKELV